ncbi:hypothetical protein SLS62_011203 [Diatrype stigma]|uniref:Uncharacterized protein n=1 Tax=Diatrype stigma TaxID=117547 RepID=A0AAN9YEX4_9PEZI
MTMEPSAEPQLGRGPLGDKPPRDSASRSSNQSSSPGGAARAPGPLAHPPPPPPPPRASRHVEFLEPPQPQGPPRLPPLQRSLKAPLQMVPTPPVVVEPGWEIQPRPGQTPGEARMDYERPMWMPATLSPSGHASNAWLERFRDWAPPPLPEEAGGRTTREDSADAEKPPGPLPPIQGPAQREPPRDH